LFEPAGSRKFRALARALNFSRAAVAAWATEPNVSAVAAKQDVSARQSLDPILIISAEEEITGFQTPRFDVGGEGSVVCCALDE
jgi:hypothetical protein